MKLKIKVGDMELEWSTWFPFFFDWRIMGENMKELITFMAKKCPKKIGRKS